jgi:Flp pilus assembly protein TadG
MHAFLREISRFARDKSGNLVVIFAFACIPLISAVGCAIDYSIATRMKAKLQSAADSASVASISQRSPGYVAAAAMSGSGPVTAAVTDANNVFDSNIFATTGYTNLARTSTVTKTGIKLDSSVQFSADVPVTFMKVLGYQKLTVTGVSSASDSLPPYLDFYLMLDVSESMGLPSTDAEQTRLAAVNPDMFSQYPGGCTLACHFTVANSCANGNQRYPTGNACLGYWITRTNPTAYATLVNTANSVSLPKATPPSLPTAMITSGLPDSLLAGNAKSVSSSLPAVASCPTPGTSNCIQLRADAVGYAVKELFVKANDSKKVTDQFRIGLYPFVRHLYAYFALTSSISGDENNSSTINYAAKNLASQLDTNANASLGSGGTHFENAFPEMSTIITAVGDGSSPTNTQPYVFFVTDGAEDPQVKALNGGSWSGSNHATTIPLGNASYCKPLRDRGIIVSVLYIPYQPIQNANHAFANDEDGFANSNIANIPASLQDCASPGFFYTANSPADITAALKAMFDHALVTAHITN